MRPICLAGASLAFAAVLAACGGSPISVEEFCDLSRQIDIETVRLVQLDPGSAEFEAQLAVVRALDDELFSNPPDDIANVANELQPLLSDRTADNERVNQLLDRIAAYVEQNCSGVQG